MKKITTALTLLLIVYGTSVIIAQTAKQNQLTKENFYFDADNLAYYLEGARLGIIPFNQSVPVKPAEFKSTKIESTRAIDDSPDVAITTATNTTQSENSVFVDPNDNQHVLNSNNSIGWDGTTITSLYGADYFRTYNAGSSWSGSTAGAGGTNNGDPAVAITNTARRYVGYIGDNGGQGVSYSINGTTWTPVDITGAYYYPNLMDKNHLMVDNTPAGAYEGNVYSVWTHLEYTTPVPTNHRMVEFAWSTNDGVSYSTHDNISAGVSAGYMCQGANIQIGPTGQVYVCFTIYDNAAAKAPNDETAIGFTKSLNGGASFTTAIRAIDNIEGLRRNGIFKDMRVNSFPSMAVDVSGGAFDGNIYIVWANRGTPGINTGTNVSVYMIKSTNDGTNWSSAIKVNQGAFIDGKEAYIPWITCDPATGNLFCIFYDDRNTAATDVETWVAYSIDGGNTWEDFRVSDVSFTPDGIPGMAGNYFGDYLGITALDNYVYPCWTDNRSGVALTYVSPFYFSEHCYATATNLSYEYIQIVNIGSIDNTTGSDGYADYTALSTDIPLNGSELLTVINGNPYPSDRCGVWIDYNRDGDFDDTGETITVSGTPGGGPYTATISPPTGATSGECVMRIRITFEDTPEACGEVTYGEVEDYTINLTPLTPNVWTGADNYYWHNAGNWSLGHIPTADETVYMTTAGYHPPSTGSYSDECNNLIIEPGAGLTITDQTLTIHNDLNVYGNLTFNNTASRCYVYHDVFWHSGSTGSMTGLARMYVYEDWDFNAGANVQFTAGYVEFVGPDWSYIRSYEENCQFYNLLSNKTSTNVYVSNLSYADLHIAGNLYNNTSGNGSTFTSLSSYSVILDGFFNNLNNGHFYCSAGTFVFNGSPGIALKPNIGDYFNNLTINTTSFLSLDNVYSNDLVINGDMNIQSGTLYGNAFDIKVGGNWTNSGGTFSPGTSTVVFESTDTYQDVNGTETFYNVLQVNTGNYLRFYGNTTINNNLELNYFSWAYNNFNVNGTLNIDNPGSKFTANGTYANATIANLDQGGIMYCNGEATITINDLVESGIFGTYYADDPGGTLNLSNAGSVVDLGGNLHINGGTMNISGNISRWPYLHDASITMTDGILDLTCGITIYNTATYTLTDNITGGTIRTASGFSGNRADFTPSAGTFEFYGSSDHSISQSNGCTLFNVDIDKNSSKESSTNSVLVKIPDGRIDETKGNGKASSISLSSDFVITNDLTITNGTLKLDGHTLTVTGSSYFYGTLTMDNAADVFNSGISMGDQFFFYNGSTGNISAGNIYLAWGMVVYDGSSFTATPANTIHFNSAVYRGGIANDDPNTVFGNIDVNKSSGYFQIWTDGDDPIIVDGDFTLAAANEFEMQDLSMVVHGNYSDQLSSETYLYNALSKGKEGDNSSNGIENAKGNSLEGSGAKGGYLEIDTDFTLTGLMDVGDGDVLLHGNIDIATTGVLTINGGSVIADQPHFSDAISSKEPANSKDWQYLFGTINLTDGLFEISHNSIQFGSTSVNNISGGVIRCGFTFYANNDNIFQPTGGTVEFVGGGGGSYIYCDKSAGNYFNNLVIDDNATKSIHTDIEVKNNIIIEGGFFKTYFADDQFNIYIGGNWTNNVGTTGFMEGTGKVVFNGPGPGMQYINSDETFYILENNTVEAIRINNGEDNVICNSYNWISGGVSVYLGTFTALDLAQNGIYGNWFALTGSEIHLYQDAGQYVDMFGDRFFINGGLIKVYGGQDQSNWCTTAPLDLEINTGGILDFDGPGIEIYNIYGLTETITDGTIMTSGSFACQRNDFNPSGGTFEFYGGNDCHISLISGSNFEDVIINKSGGDKSSYTYKDRNSKTQTKSKSNIAYMAGNNIDVLGNLDINAGTLTYYIGALTTLNCYGDININDGGILSVNDAATLALDAGSYLHANSGGIFQIIGSVGNEAQITRISSGYYNLYIEDGGMIGAEHALFEYISTSGVYLRPGSLVDPAFTFNNCTFQNGNSISNLITKYNTQTFQVNNAHFPTNTWGGDYNVKNTSIGDITFYNATGGFAGPEFEFDDYNTIHWTMTPYEVDLKVFLEGPYNDVSSKMDLDLNSLVLIPTSQPFDINPLADWYYTGSESVGSIPTFAVDWILVELRDAPDVTSALPGRVIARQAGFVTNTGTVVGLDGLNPMDFNAAIFNNLYVTVYHRNHLGVISTNPLINAGGTYSYSFYSGSGQAYGGTSAQVQLSPSIWGILSGDANGSGNITSHDIDNYWGGQAGETGYNAGDFNLDGQVNNPDKNDYWVPNFGSGSYIPE